MDTKLTPGALKLIVSPLFNNEVAEISCIPADAWLEMSPDEQLNTEMPKLVKKTIAEKSSLLTKKLLDIQSKTDASADEMVQAFTHFIEFLEAQKTLLAECRKLSATL